jgi:ABC-type Fe3+-hydroxamate transport system substrate-binding protein
LRPLTPRRRVGYFVWQQPFMVAGQDTFINDMLDRCGLDNAFADREGRYPEVTVEEVSAAELDAVLLSSEPFPFREQHRADLARQVPDVDVRLVDGEMMSWYGSRLRLAAGYLRELIGRLELR